MAGNELNEQEILSSMNNQEIDNAIASTKQEIEETLTHWKKMNLEKNLRKLQVEILRLKLGGGSQGLIQHLQQNYKEHLHLINKLNFVANHNHQ